MSNFVINSYLSAGDFAECESDGTASTYIDNNPRSALITQIGTAGTFEWLDETASIISFWLKGSGNSGNISAYQVNSGGTIMTSTDSVNSASLTGSFAKYTFNFASDFTLSASTGIGVIRSSGSGTFNISFTPSNQGSLSDCVVNQGWDDGGEGNGNLNMCVGDI